MRGDRPRPAVEQRGRRGERSGPLAAGHRVGAHVARQRSSSTSARVTASSGAALTLPTSVTTASVVRQRLGHHLGQVVGRHRDHHQLGAYVVRVDVRGAEHGRDPEVLEADVAQRDVDAVAAQRQRDRRTQQAGADDQDRALKPHPGPRGRG